MSAMMSPLSLAITAAVLAVSLVIPGAFSTNQNLFQGTRQHNIGRSNGARNEDQPSPGSCRWESPPKNGSNFQQCDEELCSEKVGSHKLNGSLRFTKCSPHHVLVGGSDRDACLNGKWTSVGHRCIPCGRSTLSPYEDLALINAGHVSSRGDFPWMAALYRLESKNYWVQICGGTLISPNLVLTAYACLDYQLKTLEVENVRVGLGKLNRSYDQQEATSIISTVKEIVHQDRYRGADHYYELDIALLVLSSSVVTGPYIMPACVDWSATMEPKHDEEGYLAGWGYTEEGTSSPVLKWTTQKYVQYSKCASLMDPLNLKLITQDKFCAAPVKGGMADKGDSGGGLTMLRSGAHYVYGILSTRPNLNSNNILLYTDVMNAGHLAWLQTQRHRLLLDEPKEHPTVN